MSSSPLVKIRDRIRELRRVPAHELLPNSKNWRKHPPNQQNAMRAVLREIGFADALLAREDENGRLILIDGHLRAEISPDMEVPVLILDVNENEADKILATLDPLAGMAELDMDAFRTLADGKHGNHPILTCVLPMSGSSKTREVIGSSTSGKPRASLTAALPCDADNLSVVRKPEPGYQLVFVG